VQYIHITLRMSRIMGETPERQWAHETYTWADIAGAPPVSYHHLQPSGSHFLTFDACRQRLDRPHAQAVALCTAYIRFGRRHAL
jgi:hypothetical protein